MLIRYLSAKIPYQYPIPWLSTGLQVACYRRQRRAAAWDPHRGQEQSKPAHSRDKLPRALRAGWRAAYVRAVVGFGTKLDDRPTARATGEHSEPQFIAKMSVMKIIWPLRNPSVSMILFLRSNSLPSRFRAHEIVHCVRLFGFPSYFFHDCSGSGSSQWLVDLLQLQLESGALSQQSGLAFDVLPDLASEQYPYSLGWGGSLLLSRPSAAPVFGGGAIVQRRAAIAQGVFSPRVRDRVAA